MLAATLVAGGGAWIAHSPVAAGMVVLAGTGLTIIGTFFPESERYARRTSDDERFRSLVLNSADVISVHDSAGETRWVSDSAALLGWTADDYASRPIAAYIHPDERNAFLSSFGEVARRGATVRHVEVRAKHRDGTWRWVDAMVTNWLDDPAIGGVVVSQRDATERRERQELAATRAAREAGIAQLGRLALEGADPATLADSATAIIAHTLEIESCELYRAIDEGHQLVLEAATGPSVDFVNELVTRADPSSQAGYTMMHGEVVSQSDLTGETRFGVSPHAANFGVRSALSTVISGQSGRYGVILVQSGHEHRFTAEDTTFLQSIGNALALALERRSVEEEARHAALHDPLTGLANRALFLDRLQHAIDNARRNRGQVGVLFVDLDHFKVINDSLGHRAGDELLEVVAERITAVMRPGDMIARFGGDEFTILCERMPDEADIEIIADRVRAALETAVTIEGNQVRISASIGITVVDPYREPNIDAGAVLRDADAAMYRAKDTGRARFAIFDDSMRLQAMNRLKVEADLRAAIRNDELMLHYQPIVSATTGQVVCLEALARWEHPDRGWLDPEQFVPIAEETDLINRLSEWVLHSAARQARAWDDEGRDVMVSVNMSARHLERNGLLDTVLATLDQTGLDARRMCLEMTETILMRDVAQSMSALWRLKDLGVCLAVDDFGTGYSSLAYLKRLPVDILKIDRSFVDGIATDREDRAIVEAIVSLAHSLGIVAVGEGVEDQNQLAALRSLECDLVQGFHLAVPRPAPVIDFDPVRAVTAPSTTVARTRVDSASKLLHRD